MKNLTFSKDEGNQFYTELHKRVNSYFSEKGIAESGNNLMLFKIFLYFSLDILFYYLMITSNTLFEFYLFYLLMGVAVIGTAFNISHDACHGIAVKSKLCKN